MPPKKKVNKAAARKPTENTAESTPALERRRKVSNQPPYKNRSAKSRAATAAASPAQTSSTGARGEVQSEVSSVAAATSEGDWAGIEVHEDREDEDEAEADGVNVDSAGGFTEEADEDEDVGGLEGRWKGKERARSPTSVTSSMSSLMNDDELEALGQVTEQGKYSEASEERKEEKEETLKTVRPHKEWASARITSGGVARTEAANSGTGTATVASRRRRGGKQREKLEHLMVEDDAAEASTSKAFGKKRKKPADAVDDESAMSAGKRRKTTGSQGIAKDGTTKIRPLIRIDEDQSPTSPISALQGTRASRRTRKPKVTFDVSPPRNTSPTGSAQHATEASPSPTNPGAEHIYILCTRCAQTHLLKCSLSFSPINIPTLEAFHVYGDRALFVTCADCQKANTTTESYAAYVASLDKRDEYRPYVQLSMLQGWEHYKAACRHDGGVVDGRGTLLGPKREARPVYNVFRLGRVLRAHGVDVVGGSSAMRVYGDDVHGFVMSIWEAEGGPEGDNEHRSRKARFWGTESEGENVSTAHDVADPKD